MSMRSIWLVFASVCLLLAPVAAAQGLSATSFETDGIASVEGGLVALTTGERTDQAWQFVSLQATAARLHAVVERMPVTYEVAGASVGTGGASETQTWDFEDASVRWAEGGRAPFLMAWPGREATLQAQTTELRVAPGASESVSEPLKDGASDGVSVQVTGSYDATGAMQSLVIRGDVRMAIHDARLTVTHAQGEDELDILARSHHPTPGGLVEGSQAAYGYLFFEDATVTLRPAGPIPQGVLFLDAPRIESTGTLSARQAQGTAFGVPIGGLAPADAHFHGPVSAQLARPESGQAVAILSGAPESVVVGGRSVVLEDGPSWVPWTGAFALVALLAVAALSSTPGQRVRRLERRLGRGDVTHVARVGPRLFRSHVADRARLAVTVALLRQRDAASALSVLGGARSTTASTRLLLEAHAAAIQRDVRTARDKVEACLRLAPSMRAQVMAMEDLAPLLEGGGYA